MRFVLLLLAVLTMLAGPVSATAAQVACDRDAAASITGMNVPAAHVDTPKTTNDPCCNHSGNHKMSDRNCAQACATTCAVGAAPPLSPTGAAFILTIARLTPATLSFVTAHEPSGLKRPPKSIL